MEIRYEAGFYRVSHITGPNAVLLMLALTENVNNEVAMVEWLPFSLPKGHEQPAPEVVRAAVMQGVVEANDIYGCNFQVTVVKHHTDHMPSRAYALYQYLAFRLAEFAAGKIDEEA